MTKKTSPNLSAGSVPPSRLHRLGHSLIAHFNATVRISWQSAPSMETHSYYRPSESDGVGFVHRPSPFTPPTCSGRSRLEWRLLTANDVPRGATEAVACSARCRARRRSETWPLRSAPCRPRQSGFCRAGVLHRFGAGRGTGSRAFGSAGLGRQCCVPERSQLQIFERLGRQSPDADLSRSVPRQQGRQWQWRVALDPEGRRLLQRMQ